MTFQILVVPALAAALLLPSSASAQYSTRPVPGETYRIEVTYAYWNPNPTIVLSSDAPGVAGTAIDFTSDLGLTQHRLSAFQIVLHPAKKHKLLFQSIPISYGSTATLPREVVFNGVHYPAGQSVASTLDWKTYRFGYEYDFVSRQRGFAGLTVEARQTVIEGRLKTDSANESRRTSVPIPALGGVVRYYPEASLSLTGQVVGFWVPDRSDKKFGGHYVDADAYATLDLTTNISAQFGYRSFDIRHLGEEDSGKLRLKGYYFGGVVRY